MGLFLGVCSDRNRDPDQHGQEDDESSERTLLEAVLPPIGENGNGECFLHGVRRVNHSSSHPQRPLEGMMGGPPDPLHVVIPLGPYRVPPEELRV